ncbi:hypothetical protein R6U77_02695 [Lysinibacillus louembei]|uniref:Glycosyl hydrolase lipoprotein n=1 Tax=Lysinibacillus louembei TaxID=1470088 RepID=A0ABZ0RYS4_9BACI|nr:hypothetical protein [Lysinibacillus louembei]WPK12625.1 hypothetical protein R6U77_02695 [Lysinibacillus louembei]
MKRIMKGFLIFSILVLIGCEQEKIVEQMPPLSPTEQFVLEQLINKNGLLQTDMQQQKKVFLSESVGLWLTYLLEKEDRERFQEQVDVLKQYFITDDLIVWRMDGDKKATVNAFIDDLRIIHVLLEAGERWNTAQYISLAKELGKQLTKYGMLDGIFVDFVDIYSKDKATTIMLSYILPNALQKMVQYDVITNEQMAQQIYIVQNAQPTKEGFYPKSYDILAKEYTYDTELHMIDQLYTALNKLQLGESTDMFTQWLLKLYERDGQLYGRYEASTNLPAVPFESPAVYALATSYMLALGNKEMANQFFQRMHALRNDELLGYIDTKTKATHIFDNLLPLMTEREMEDANNDKRN